MSFQDGMLTGDLCPKCGKPTIFFMGFTDQFSPVSGHYTTDRKLVVCDNEGCDYTEEFIDNEVEEWENS